MGQNVTVVGRNLSENKKELKKHAATIHCSNTLSLLQRKITNALLYHAYKELETKQEHEITIKQLCRLIGYQGNNHAAIKEALKGLISTVIEWNVIDDRTGNENWTASSIIASVSLEGPLCYYAYSPRMQQLLHSPSMFGKIDLVIQSRFRSSYGLALYENCIRYRGLPQTKWFEIELFKKLMGVPTGKYDIFRDFKRRVLDKAVDEVNTYSDLIIQSELLREGRKVVKIRFQLEERPKKTRLGMKQTIQKNLTDLTNEANTTLENELQTKLKVDFGLTEEQIDALFKEYDEQFLMDKVMVVETSKPYQEGKIQSLAGYLLSAIKHNYLAPKPKPDNVLDIQGDHLYEMREVKQIIEEIRKEYALYRETTIEGVIQSLDPRARTQFMQDFFKAAHSTIKTILQLQHNKYSPENILDSPSVKAELRHFAIRELDLLSLFSLEEYVAQLTVEKREIWQKLKSYDPDHPLTKFQDT